MWSENLICFNMCVTGTSLSESLFLICCHSVSMLSVSNVVIKGKMLKYCEQYSSVCSPYIFERLDI